MRKILCLWFYALCLYLWFAVPFSPVIFMVTFTLTAGATATFLSSLGASIMDIPPIARSSWWLIFGSASVLFLFIHLAIAFFLSWVGALVLLVAAYFCRGFLSLIFSLTLGLVTALLAGR